MAVTTTPVAPPPNGPPGAVPIVDTPVAGRPLGWWGMLGLISSEGTLFGLLFFVYAYLRANNHPWPPTGVADPELVRSGIRTAVMAISFVPAALAARALRAGKVRRFKNLILVTLVLGVAYLIGHTLEYLRVSKVFTPTSSAYGSVFYVVTGLDAVHVFVGVVIFAYVYTQGLRGRYDGGGDRIGVRCAVLYWQFVVVLWIVMWIIMYVSERL